MRKEVLAFIGADQDMLVIHAFDALGEEHGRKEFAWALDIEGAIDQTKGNMKLRDVSALQGNFPRLFLQIRPFALLLAHFILPYPLLSWISG